MKTLIKKLKLGTLASAFILLLLSCMGDGNVINGFNNNTKINSATEKWNQSITGNRLHNLKGVQIAGLTKSTLHPNQIITALPISFGIADAVLFSN